MDLGFRHLVTKFNGQDFTYKFNNGSQIQFMAESFDSDKELFRFRGLEISGAFFDEVNELQEKTFNIVKTRCRWKSDAPIKLMGTCNPSHNWVKNRFYDKWIKEEEEPNETYISAKVTDNPFLSDEYLSALKALPALEYRQMVEGDWDLHIVDNPFAYEYNPIEHESNQYLYNPELQIYFSMDFNLNPFGGIFAHIFRNSEGKESLHIFDEISIENGNIYSMTDEIKRMYPEKILNMMVTGDAMGRQRNISQRDHASLYEQFRRNLNISQGQIKVSNNPNHQKSRVDCNLFLKHFPEIKIGDRCENLKRDMKIVQCDLYGKIKKSNRSSEDQRADHLDCFRYMVHNFMKQWVDHKRKTLNISYLS